MSDATRNESRVVQWRVYYDDVPPQDSLNATVMGVRGEGVQAIAQRDATPGDPYAVGRELLFDADFYCWNFNDERWFRCDLYGLFDYLRRPGFKKVLAGRTANRAAYKRALIAAQSDPDFPPKSAIQAGEERLRG
jgi:hypothetical protein